LSYDRVLDRWRRAIVALRGPGRRARAHEDEAAAIMTIESVPKQQQQQQQKTKPNQILKKNHQPRANPWLVSAAVDNSTGSDSVKISS